MKFRASRWLAVALAVLTVGLAVGSAVLYVARDRRFDVVDLAAVLFLAFPAMGVLLAIQRPRNPIGWMLLAIGIDLFVIISIEDYAGYALVLHPGSLPAGWLAEWMTNWAWVPFPLLVVCLLPLLFPTGRLLSPRWRVVAASGLAFSLIAGVANALMPGSVSTAYPTLKNPIALESARPLLETLISLSLPFGLFALIGSMASVIVRFRRASAQVRQQLKWFIAAYALAIIPFALNNVNDTLSQVLTVLIVPLLPIAIAIAVLRYRLYDIDVLISRTLLFGTLAAFITAVYVGIVVGVGNIIGSGGRPNVALSILATAVVAVAFQPVRQYVQRIANQLVYGKRSTPYEVLAQFSDRVAGAYSSEEILPRLAQVLAEGTGATRADVWIRIGSEIRPAASWPVNAASPPVRATLNGLGLPDVAGVTKMVPVRHQGELLGALSITKLSSE